jgi:hypothetical protein
MIAANVNIKVISEWMGYPSVSITMDIYGQLMSGVGRSAAEQADRFLEEILDGENGNENPLENVAIGCGVRSAPRGIRTHDPRFRRPMLCPLSYRRPDSNSIIAQYNGDEQLPPETDWWGEWRDSNPRSPGPQPGALTTGLHSPSKAINIIAPKTVSLQSVR